MGDENKTLECSFCSKKQHEVKRLIAGADVYICDDCVALCSSILKQEDIETKEEEKLPTKKDKNAEIPSPKEIREFLDQYIVGQDYAKMVVSVAVSNHYKRISTLQDGDEVELEKSNILLIGPSGSGKTLIGQTIARMLDVPFVIADATSLTEAGYVGDDVESIITRLVQAANYDIRKAERGIVYIDEIDKKAKKESATGSRDISGEGVQQALLKIIEGSDVRVPPVGGKKNGQSETITVNTRNILFIIGGAFVSLEDVVRKRVNKGATGIGFHSDPRDKKEGNLTELFQQIESEDLISYGLIPELVGRIPVVAALEELTEEQLVSILTEPKNSITKQFRKLFSLENVGLEFTTEALTRIAKIAKEKKTGARGLRSIIEQKLIRVQYELNELQQAGCEKVIVDVAAIEGTSEPQKVYGTPKAE
jgi:ATP-dependent Clp protease ATP-binding subunit ClpX